MRNLLKADFYRLLKSKMGYILIIVCVLLSLFSIGTYAVVKAVSTSITVEEEDAALVVDAMINGRMIMFGNFSLSSNIGILIPIFVGIFTLTDIRHGTIRNKVLIGENRTKIYLSHFIVSTTLSVVAALLSFLVLLIGGLILFGYGFTFNGDEALNFIRCLVIGILSFIYVASISTFFALVTKSTPMTVLLTLAVTLGLSIVIGISFMLPTRDFDKLFYIIPTYSSLIVSQGGYISVEIFLYGLFSLLIFIVLNTILGIYLFKKIDLK